RERFPLPIAPALAQAHPGETRHEVKLRRPDVAKRHRVEFELAVNDRVMMGDQPLGRDVVLVEAEVRLAHVERPDRLARRDPLELRNADLDYEAATRLEMQSDILEASDLLILCRQVVDRVEDEVGGRETPVAPRRGEVADRDLDVLGAGLGPQPRHHRLGEVDSVNTYAAF